MHCAGDAGCSSRFVDGSSCRVRGKPWNDLGQGNRLPGLLPGGSLIFPNRATNLEVNMKIIKSATLGSAAVLVALGGARAADLPVKAKAVEYVRICSLYGPGFLYIPGTDTCIKLGGYLRVDTTFNGGPHGLPAWSGDLGQQTRYRDYFAARSRIPL